MGLRCFGWGWEIGLYNYRGSLLSLMFVMLSLATNKSTSCIAAMVAVPKQTHLPSNDRQNLTKSLWKPGEHDWTLWCNTATTCVGNGHYPVHYWAESDHWKKVSQIWWRCSIMLVFIFPACLWFYEDTALLCSQCEQHIALRKTEAQWRMSRFQLYSWRERDPLINLCQCKYNASMSADQRTHVWRSHLHCCVSHTQHSSGLIKFTWSAHINAHICSSASKI